MQFITFGGIALVAIFIGIGIRFQPTYLGEAGAPSAESQTETAYSGSSGDRSVTCNQDCQVQFGPRQFPKPEKRQHQTGPDKTESERTQKTREGLDLLAQRRMAYWSIWIAGFTFSGLLVLGWTLWETRQVGKNQTQAYLSIDSAVVRLRRHQMVPGPEEWGVNLEILIKNYGHSPAKKVTIECTDAFIWAEATGNSEIELFSSEGAFIGYHKFTQDTFSSDIAPSAVEPARMYSDLLSAEHTEKLLHRINKVSVRGKIKWTTEFDDERKLPFHIETAPFAHNDLVNDDGSPNPNRVILMDRLPQQHPTEEPQNA